MNIAVIYGSDTAESEVSCRSGEFVASRLDESKFNVYEIYARNGDWQLMAFRKLMSMNTKLPEGSRPQVDKSDFSVCLYGEKIKFDYAYILQHGSPGEDGLMQAYLEMLSIPYSTCSSRVSTIAFDKYYSKVFLREANIVKMAKHKLLRAGEQTDKKVSELYEGLNFPIFVKSTSAGSSFGLSKVNKEEDLLQAINYSFSEGSMVLLEEGIKGREFTCAVYKADGEVKALPIIEIISDNDYFDYEAKYKGLSSEICPAEVSDDLRKEIQEKSCQIYDFFACRGVVRIDYIYAEDGLYFLELNTIPGMTSASLLPKMIRTAGMSVSDFLSIIVENTK